MAEIRWDLKLLCLVKHAQLIGWHLKWALRSFFHVGVKNGLKTSITFKLVL